MRHALPVMLAVLAVVVGLIIAIPPQAGLAKSPGTFVFGDGIEGTIKLPLQEATVLWNARPEPRRLERPPDSLGDLYTVSSWYWDTIEPGGTFAVNGGEASYFPAEGVIRIQHSEGESWYELDPIRQALLARYVTQGLAGWLPAEPNIVMVMRLARSAGGEAIVIEVAGERIDIVSAPEYEPLLWEGFGFLSFRAIWVFPTDFDLTATHFGPDSWPDHVWPQDFDEDFFVGFVLPEGRTVELLYSRRTGYLIDITPIRNGTGVPTLDGFVVHPPMRELLERIADEGLVSDAGYALRTTLISGSPPVRGELAGARSTTMAWPLVVFVVALATVATGSLIVAEARRR